MRTALLALLAAALLCLCAVPAAQAARPAAPEASLEFKGAKKAVPFSHKAHAASDCGVCHHPVNGQETYAKCASSGCHEDLTGRQPPALWGVVHSKKELKFQTCVSCHAKVAEQKPDQKKALTGCKGSLCHS